MNIEELNKSAESGDGLSSYILGRCYYSGELDQKVDFQKSFEYFEYGAKKLKDPRCMYGLGLFYYNFEDDEPEGVVEKDNEIAIELFSQAYPQIKDLAESGEMYSIFIMGSYSYYGYGVVEINHSKALEYINKSANLGHSGACFDMGKFYLNGKMGLEKDVEKAKYYLYKASELGNSNAKNMIKENNL